MFWKKTKGVRSDRSKAMALADKWFSRFIRLRATDEEGYVQCFTCGKRAHWKDVDCGHYCGRRHMTTRYNDVNCQPQCRNCNRMKEGNKPIFAVNLDRKYGSGTAERLTLLSNTKTKTSLLWFADQTNRYKAMCKQISRGASWK